MNHGLWVWPADPRAQRKVLASVSASDHLVKALAGIVKSKEGLSNSEVDELVADNSNWMTLWVVRQLTSLGFVEYKVDLFGGPAKYVATDLGKNALSMVTGQPMVAPKPVAPSPQPAPAPSPKA